MRERGLTRLFIGGLAYDVCVRHSAEDAIAAGFAVVIIEMRATVLIATVWPPRARP